MLWILIGLPAGFAVAALAPEMGPRSLSQSGWRRVRDMDGEVGWMHMALLTRDRTAVVTTGPGAEVHARDDTTSQVVAQAQAGAIGRLLGCSMLACEIEFAGAEGWIARARLWGIHGGEEY